MRIRRTADNYFFENELSAEMFEGTILLYLGPMVTVLEHHCKTEIY
jgi:hypothetical protein